MNKKEQLPALLIIGGPTASGKSRLAEELAFRYDLPIISADSRQIYRGLDIGTAKPTRAVLTSIRYEMIDICAPHEVFSAGKFAEMAAQLIQVKYQNEPAIIISGGTGFYISALMDGLAQIPAINPETDQKWNQLLESQGIAALQEAIKTVDPLYMKRGDTANPHRLLRAAKVADQTGRSIYEYIPRSPLQGHYQSRWYALKHERAVLYRRINERVDQMIYKGLVEEVRGLLPYRDDPAMESVGYRELLPYFYNEISLPEAVEKIKQHSRNYAKRQLTWMRKQDRWNWIHPEDTIQIHDWLKKFI